ncbi:MAG: sugar-binding domain-containing protein, partial [Sphaerochaetaceae bacterium]
NRGLVFIPLCGVLSSSGNSWYANNICQNFAAKTNGRYFLLNAPNYLSNKDTKKLLLGEKTITDVLDKGQKCDVVLVGIGSLSAQSTGVLAGGLSEQELEVLRSEGAVANICCSYINGEGKVIETSIGNRILGQSIEDVSKSRKVGIAMGQEKTEAIKAVLKGKLVDVFITSLDTAKRLI